MHERGSSEICSEKAKTRSSRGQVEHRRAGGQLHSRRQREIIDERRVFQVIHLLSNSPDLKAFKTEVYHFFFSFKITFRIRTFEEDSNLKEFNEVFAFLAHTYASLKLS